MDGAKFMFMVLMACIVIGLAYSWLHGCKIEPPKSCTVDQTTGLTCEH